MQKDAQTHAETHAETHARTRATYSSFVAVGDSFTEGMSDLLPDRSYRGWADLLAARLAADSRQGQGQGQCQCQCRTSATRISPSAAS